MAPLPTVVDLLHLDACMYTQPSILRERCGSTHQPGVIETALGFSPTPDTFVQGDLE